MATLILPHCTHCDAKDLHCAPGSEVMLFVGETVAESFFNVRCPECAGLSHYNADRIGEPELLRLCAWLTTPDNMPMVAPASHGDEEIAEICEIQSRCLLAISMDDVLDGLNDIRRLDACDDFALALGVKTDG